MFSFDCVMLTKSRNAYFSDDKLKTKQWKILKLSYISPIMFFSLPSISLPVRIRLGCKKALQVAALRFTKTIKKLPSKDVIDGGSVFPLEVISLEINKNRSSLEKLE